MAQQERECGWTWTVMDVEQQRLASKAARAARFAGSATAAGATTTTVGKEDTDTSEAEGFRFVWATGEYVNVVPDRGDESREHTRSVRVEDGRATVCSCREDAEGSDPCEHREAVEADLLG